MSTAPAATPPPLLSLCLIVRNERPHLARCLASVRGLVDEIVVVDTGSNDGTQDVARAHGARLIQATWENDFSRARNLALDAARGRWILVLDADEYLPETEHDALRALLHAHTPPAGDAPSRAFGLLQKSTSDGGRTGMLVNIIRLFPNRPDVRFAWPVHEQVATSLARAGIPLENTAITFLHTGYALPARNREKQLRNRDILAAQIASGRDVSPLTHFLLAGCHLDLGDAATALAYYREAQRLARAEGDRDIAGGATVRLASCLVQLERFGDVVSLAVDDEADPHPEMLNLRALAEEKLGRPEVARDLRERVLGAANRARIPACNVAAEKIAALKALGEHWFHLGHKARAVTLLRGAMALQEASRDFGPAELAQCYRDNP